MSFHLEALIAALAAAAIMATLVIAWIERRQFDAHDDQRYRARSLTYWLDEKTTARGGFEGGDFEE